MTLSGVLEPAEQVAAYAARGQMIRGSCATKECNRKVRLDPKDLCGHGQGSLHMRQVEKLHYCHRLDGCALNFYADPKTPPLRLDWLTGRAHVRVRLRCRGNGCKYARVWVVEQMIAGLKKAGKGGGDTDVHELGRLMTAACPVCKKANWTADILWANTETLGWRQNGEKYFAGMEVGGDV
jgi:hypothetical protein